MLLAAPAAEAKKAKLDGQLIGNAEEKRSKVEAPVLLTQKSAKKMKLRSPLATLVMKGSKSVPVPNPSGGGTVPVDAGTLRSGDVVKGKGKVKGKKKLMPKVKATKLKVKDRESALSVDELTVALMLVYQQVLALDSRVDSLEASLQQQIDALRAEIEALKAKDASLEGQINAILAQLAGIESAITDITTQLANLTTDLGVLDGQLEGALEEITNLQSDLGLLGADLAALDDQLNNPTTGIAEQVGELNDAVATLETNVEAICNDPLLGVVCI